MRPPPRLPRVLLSRLIDPRLREAVIGDLDEIFQAESTRQPRRASLRYWTRALSLLAHLGPHATRASAHRQPTPPGDSIMTTLLRDLAHGVRLFVTQPGYALASAVTLGLAIGANTLIFTMANVLVLKPLPIQQSERLGWIFARSQDDAQWRGPVSLPEYVRYRDGVPAFAALSAFQRRPLTLSDGSTTDRVLGQFVIGDLQTLWGLRAVQGRTLEDGDERRDAPAVMVLSHRFWATRFGGRADIVGTELRIDGQHRSVVGVLAPDIELGSLSEIDVWLPFQGEPALAARTDRSWRAVGRLREGETVESAHAAVAAIAAQMAAEYPETDQSRTARVGPTRDALGSADTWVILSMLVTVVGLLLLLACANVMNLLIARLIARRQELAVRVALGATRARIVRQIVAESLIVGVTGGALGLAIARGGLAAIHAVSHEPFFRQLALDGQVMAFAAVLAFVAPLLFSIVPTLRLFGSDVRGALSDGSTRTIGSRASSHGQSALVVVQVTLAVTLLVVAGLVVQSINAITSADVGYPTGGLISTQIEIPRWKTPDDAEAYRVRQRILTRVHQLADHRGVATMTEIPALYPSQQVSFTIDGRVPADTPNRPTAALTVTSPRFFDVVRLPIVAGRGFEDGDAATPAPVAVISRETARRYFGGTSDALGRQLTISGEPGEGAAATVVGVVADVANPDLDRAPQPQLYVLDAHRPTRSFYLVVASDAPGMAARLRAAVRDVDADLTTAQLRTIDEAFREESSSGWMLGGLFAAFAIVAVLLATAGLYGVLSYAVSQRTPEIAIRIALGASTRNVATGVAGHSLKLAAVGVGIGLVASFGLAQAMRSILFGIGPSDPATYLAVLVTTALAALAAAWLPMRRAVRVDPVEGLRRG